MKKNELFTSVFRQKARSAFTLLEMLAVLTIIGLVLTLIIKNVGSANVRANDDTAHAMVEGTLGPALDEYQLDNACYPTTAQGLKALVEKPTSDPLPSERWRKYLMKKVPKDPWGNEYIYVYPGAHNPDSYDLSSMGKNKLAGDDDDIKNWE